jgi:hypothetical protein
MANPPQLAPFPAGRAVEFVGNFHLGRRPALDGLRGVAVILVMLCHTTVFLVNRQYLTGGSIGVDLFSYFPDFSSPQSWLKNSRTLDEYGSARSTQGAHYG